MQFIGPMTSGAAAGEAGSATANATTSNKICGVVKAVWVKYEGSPPAETTDITVATVGSAHPATTILSITNAATDGVFYPHAQAQLNDGTALTYDGTYKVPAEIAIFDNVKVTIAGANAADYVTVWMAVE